jgi:hypothetical protein
MADEDDVLEVTEFQPSVPLLEVGPEPARSRVAGPGLPSEDREGIRAASSPVTMRQAAGQPVGVALGSSSETHKTQAKM